MLNSKRIRWNNSRKLGAEIFMQSMQNCTILATVSERTKETYHQWSVAKKRTQKPDLEVAYNIQQAQAEM